MGTTSQPVSPLDGATLVDELMRNAFERPRTPRSDEYKLGVLWLLNFRVDGIRQPCPFHPGTAEADAFFAGRDEGNEIWRAYMAANPANFVGG